MNTTTITQINRIVQCPQCRVIIDGIDIDLDVDTVKVGQIVGGWYCCDECGTNVYDDYRVRRSDVR